MKPTPPAATLTGGGPPIYDIPQDLYDEITQHVGGDVEGFAREVGADALIEVATTVALLYAARKETA